MQALNGGNYSSPAQAQRGTSTVAVVRGCTLTRDDALALYEQGPEQVKAILTDDPTESPLYQPFQEMPASISEVEQTRLREEAVRLYRDSVAPAFWRLHRYLVDTYLPNARTAIGYSRMPEG